MPEIKLHGIYIIEHMQVSKYSSSESSVSLGWNSLTSMSFFPCLSFHCTRRFDPLMPFRAVPPAGCGESSARRSTETTASPFEPAGAAAGARDPAAGEGEARFLPLPLQDTLLKLRRSIAGWHQTPRPPTSIPPADSIQSVMQSTSPRISKHPANSPQSREGPPGGNFPDRMSRGWCAWGPGQRDEIFSRSGGGGRIRGRIGGGGKRRRGEER